MKIKELIEKLEKYNPEREVGLIFLTDVTNDKAEFVLTKTYDVIDGKKSFQEEPKNVRDKLFIMSGASIGEYEMEI